MQYFIKKIIALLFTIILCLGLRAQLKAGDHFPDITIHNLINNPTDELQLSSLRGKLIILDFWNRYCGSCIEGFPHLDSLQMLFADKLKIILVNEDRKDSTLTFFKKRKWIKLPAVTMATSDTILHQLFPHEGNPYSAWIDTAGKLQYLTLTYNATVDKITAFWKGELLDMIDPQKKKPFSNTAIDANNKGMYYSWLGAFADKTMYTTLDESNNTIPFIQISCNSCSIVQLYQKAFEQNNTFNFRNDYALELKVARPSLLTIPDDKNVLDEWCRANLYHYIQHTPVAKGLNVFTIMKKDLSSWFPFKAKVCYRKLPAVSLQRISKKDLLKTKGGPPIDSFMGASLLHPTDDSVRVMQNKPFTQFIRWMRLWLEWKYPFVDQTGYKGNIDISLTESTIFNLDIHSFNNELRKYGLKMVKTISLTPVLVISDKQKSSRPIP